MAEEDAEAEEDSGEEDSEYSENDKDFIRRSARIHEKRSTSKRKRSSKGKERANDISGSWAMLLDSDDEAYTSVFENETSSNKAAIKDVVLVLREPPCQRCIDQDMECLIRSGIGKPGRRPMRCERCRRKGSYAKCTPDPDFMNVEPRKRRRGSLGGSTASAPAAKKARVIPATAEESATEQDLSIHPIDRMLTALNEVCAAMLGHSDQDEEMASELEELRTLLPKLNQTFEDLQPLYEARCEAMSRILRHLTTLSDAAKDEHKVIPGSYVPQRSSRSKLEKALLGMWAGSSQQMLSSAET